MGHRAILLADDVGEWYEAISMSENTAMLPMLTPAPALPRASQLLVQPPSFPMFLNSRALRRRK
jgi:hypothetical protein